MSVRLPPKFRIEYEARDCLLMLGEVSLGRFIDEKYAARAAWKICETLEIHGALDQALRERDGLSKRAEQLEQALTEKIDERLHGVGEFVAKWRAWACGLTGLPETATDEQLRGGIELANKLRKGRAAMPALTFEQACEQRDRSLAGHTSEPGLSIGGNKHHGCMDEPEAKPSTNDRRIREAIERLEFRCGRCGGAGQNHYGPFVPWEYGAEAACVRCNGTGIEPDTQNGDLTARADEPLADAETDEKQAEDARACKGDE